MNSPKGYRRQYSLVDFAANNIDECHRADCEAKLAVLNERSANDNFNSREEAARYGAVAIWHSGIGQAACLCTVHIR